jgi:hypothetical protein
MVPVAQEDELGPRPQVHVEGDDEGPGHGGVAVRDAGVEPVVLAVLGRLVGRAVVVGVPDPQIRAEIAGKLAG